MARCAALAASTGKRCGNETEPGSRWCREPSHTDGWPEASSAREPAPDAPPTPDPGPADSASDSSSGGGGSHDGPASEPAAQPRRSDARIDPSLFADLRTEGGGGGDDDGGAPLEDGDPAPAQTPAPVPTNAAAVHLSADDVSDLLDAYLSPAFRAGGKPELRPAELSVGGRVWADALNQMLRHVDPNNPWGAVSLWSLAVLGTRYAPDAIGKVTGRGRRAARPAPASSNGERQPADDRRPDPAPAPGLELEDQEEGGAPGWPGLELAQ